MNHEAMSTLSFAHWMKSSRNENQTYLLVIGISKPVKCRRRRSLVCKGLLPPKKHRDWSIMDCEDTGGEQSANESVEFTVVTT